MGIENKKIKILFVIVLFLMSTQIFSQTVQRFPKPDFQSDYTRPDLILAGTESPLFLYLDIIILLAVLSLASYFVLKSRSRRKIFLLMVFSLLYFGFFRKGCVCSVGSVQNVVYAIFNSGYAIPLAALLFFIIPLLFTLFYGRVFCAAVCPLGAIQDAVIIKPVKISAGVSSLLGILPYIYLGLAVLFASTGAGFIICQYDPFIGFFRFSANFNMLVLGIFFLILGTVVARPYCRFLCPYGVLLNWFSRLSKRHAKITPDQCNNCRLCEESCPFGAIHNPSEAIDPGQKQSESKRVLILMILTPLVIFLAGWSMSIFSSKILAKNHYTVLVAEKILNNTKTAELDEVHAFQNSGKSRAELFKETDAIIEKFKTGGWLLGGFLGFIIMLKLLSFSVHKKNPEYCIDKGHCLSCARCFSHCPYELIRQGVIKPEELENKIVELKNKR